jgi:acylphosphatase
MKTAVIIRVSGRVQGVGFRFYTQRKAIENNVFGFVQNKPDGSVYIEAEGEATDVQTFVDWCRKGPQWASVRDIQVSETLPLNRNDFVIR